MKHMKRFAVLMLVCTLAAGNALALSIFSQAKEEDTVTVTKEEYAIIEKYRRLEEVYSIIDQMYLWEYDETELLEGAARGMLGALADDYTFYYTPSEMQVENETLTGEYGGLGIEVFPNMKDDTITIKRVFYGGPSQQAGIRPADKIIGVNGEEMRAMDINDAVKIMRGEIGGKVTLTLLRDQEVFEVELERALVETQIIHSEMLEDGIAYARIYYFEGNLMGQFMEAVDQFMAEDAQGIIIDLRENPGGLVNLAIELADVFLGQQPIMFTEDKYGRQLSYYGRDGAWEIPVVVMVDAHSASASEITAAALQENGVAKIVGVQTFGKGIMQSVYPFNTDGAGLQITSDYWLTPQGNKIHEEGITPDVEVELAEDAVDDTYTFIREKDNQLQTAVETLKEMIKDR